MERTQLLSNTTFLLVINRYCCAYSLFERAKRYGPLAFLTAGYVLSRLFMLPRLRHRVIDEHRVKETRIMNIQIVPSTLDNHPIMSLLGTFRCPALPSLIANGAQYRQLIDERQGHKGTGVIRRCNAFSRTTNAHSIVPIGNAVIS